MTTPINDMNHRIASGIITEKALNDGSYLVVDFPIQDDQDPTYQPWGVSTIEGFADYSKRVRNLSGYLGKEGGVSFRVMLAVATPDMMRHMYDLIGGESGDVTISVPVKARKDKPTLWVAYTGIMDYPDTTGLVFQQNAYRLVPFAVNRATVAIAGVGFSLGFSKGFDS